MVRNRTYEAFFPLISTAVIYFAITGLLIAAINRVEIKFDPKRRTPEQISAGIQTRKYGSFPQAGTRLQLYGRDSFP